MKYGFTLLLLAIGLSSCSAPNEPYQAEIRRTSHNIPHIVANDWGSLGFGEGYAIAEDHMCTLADIVVRVRSERALFHGAGNNDRYLHSDLALKALNLRERAQTDLENYPSFIQAYTEGYAAGITHYLTETGAENVQGWCQGAPWVRPVTTLDMASYFKAIIMMAPHFSQPIALAQPPSSELAAGLAPELPLFEGASNGWGIGSDRSASGGGMLLANPHYPWVGSNRFWEKHLTLPGRLNAYGVGLIGGSGVSIGFNEHVAWTHTVSSGVRYTIFRLQLAEDDPTRYILDGEEKALEKRTVSVDVKQDDGSVESVSRDLYRTEYGPVVVLRGMEWTEENAFVLRDTNADNEEAVIQWLEMGMAEDMDTFQHAHAHYSAMPWVNTISASSDGRAWYTDVSSTPLLSPEAFERWEAQKKEDELIGGAYDSGIILLDGSDSAFHWFVDGDARDAGLVPPNQLPSLERTDYVFNANDSYWLANSSALLPGKSPLHAIQDETPRSPRTRMNDLVLADITLDGPAGEDTRFTLDELGDAALVNRSLTAELLVPELIAHGLQNPMITIEGRRVNLTAACRVLEAWDQRYDLDSRGAVLWREFITQFSGSDLTDAGDLFAIPFDPADPVGTPRGLNTESDAARQALAEAVLILERAGLALDVPLGDVQFAYRSGQRIPMHGGMGAPEGITNFISYASNGTTLEPDADVAPRVQGSRTLREDGYPVNRGTSFIMVLDFQEAGPEAKAFLTYGQSGDEGSPYFADQTKLFSKKEWRPILFTEEDIAADPNLRTYVVTAER